MDGENVLKNGSTVYFRKGGKARAFSLQVAGFEDSYSSSRAANSVSRSGVRGRRSNSSNQSDTQSVSSDSGGILSFTDAVAGDTQRITLLDDNDSSVNSNPISVTPSYNGENMGTIPIIESGMYGFKTTYEINGDEQGFCYGNYYKTYTLKISIWNNGEETCDTSKWEISYDDSNFDFPYNKTGNFSSIEPGKGWDITFDKVRYGNITSEYVDVPITIKIMDSKYFRTWQDSITLRFYRGTVALSVNARKFSTSSSAKLKGFLIYPDGRSKRFTVNAGSTEQVLVPWSESDYMLAFSGADASTEMCYSFAFDEKASLADLSGTWEIEEIVAYEPNDGATSAHSITDNSTATKAYLKNNDIDFYIVNCSELEPVFSPVTYVTHSIGDAVDLGDYNTNDEVVNPGEVVQLDIRVKNNTESTISGVSAKLSTTSEYVTIADATKNYGDIGSKKYKTAYGASNYSNYYAEGYGSNSDYYSATLGTSSGWSYTVSPDTPANTKIPFTLTFTDKNGATWTDSFSVKVEESDVKLSLVKWSCKGSVFDVRLYNSGTTLAHNVKATLSTTNTSVTIADATKNYGDIGSKKYKTAYGASKYSNSNYYYEGYGSNSNYGSATFGTSSSSTSGEGPWTLKVPSTLSSGTEIPFTLTCTDIYGKQWVLEFEMTVN